MEPYQARPPSRKLKDSCDVCSASKLRCDKKKPTCSRCSNLNRACTYSPARRAGRPHRVRQVASQRMDNNIQSHNQQYVGAPDRTSENSLAMGPAGVPDGGQLDREMTCSDHVDSGWFSGAHATIIHRQQHSRPPSAKPLASPCNTSIEGGFGVGTEQADCTKTALSIIEQLETSKIVSAVGVTRTGDGDRRNLTATEACQQLLTILMCPCSEQADVALLVASGCLSLLDVVHAAGTSQDTGLVTFERSVGGDGMSASPGSSDQEVLIWSSRPRSSSRSSLGSHGGSQVGDLSKVAKVILQFTERYGRDNKGGAQWEHTAWVVGPVAALLRCRLQSVTQGAARRIVL